MVRTRAHSLALLQGYLELSRAMNPRCPLSRPVTEKNSLARCRVSAAFTDDPLMMILWRALLGVAAAAQMPAMLGLIFAIFRDAKQRGVAIGAWAAGIFAGVALGPLLS